MRFRFLVLLILFFTIAGHTARPQEAAKPLTKNQVTELVKAGMDSAELAEKVQQAGIDFDLTDDYLQALRKAGAQDVLIQALRDARPKPLTREQVLALVAGKVPSERVAMLVKQHGIDFVPDQDYLETLRVAGAEEEVLAALRTAGESVTAQLEIETSPNAEIYLDGQLAGRAGADGQFAVKSKPGVHALKVSLASKKDFQQTVTLMAGQVNKIATVLADLPGRILIHSSVAAEVFLDSASRGRTDANGELAVADVIPGAHELRIAAPGKMENRQNITVHGGQEAKIDAPLADLPVSALAELLQPKSLPRSLDRVNIAVWFGGPLFEGIRPGLEGLSRSFSREDATVIEVLPYDAQGEETARRAASSVNSKCNFYESPQELLGRKDVDAVLFVGFSVGHNSQGLDLDGAVVLAASAGKDCYVLPALAPWRPIDRTVDAAKKYYRVIWAGDSSGDDVGSFLRSVRTRMPGAGSINRVP